jgi:predicted RNase H-like HicB family nuclease
MSRLNLKFIVWKEDDYYVAQCLNIDVSSFGDTKKEALSHLNEALDLYFEDTNVRSVSHIQRAEIISIPFRYA